MDLEFKANIAAHSFVTSEKQNNDPMLLKQAERIVEEVTNWLFTNSDDSAMELLKFDQLLQEYIEFWRKVKKGEIRAFGNTPADIREGSNSKTPVSNRRKVRVDNPKRKRNSKKSIHRGKTI